MSSYRAVVADDTEGVNSFLTWVLEETGYFEEVGSFFDGYSALKYCSEYRDDVELAMIDVSMPVGGHSKNQTQGGLYLVKGLKRKEHPVYPDGTILISGYSEEHVLKPFKDLGVYRILGKPFKREEIEKVVGEIMSKHLEK